MFDVYTSGFLVVGSYLITIAGLCLGWLRFHHQYYSNALFITYFVAKILLQNVCWYVTLVCYFCYSSSKKNKFLMSSVFMFKNSLYNVFFQCVMINYFFNLIITKNKYIIYLKQFILK